MAQAFGGAISHLGEISYDMVNRYGLAGDEGRGVVRDQPNYTAQLHSQSSTSRGGIGTLDSDYKKYKNYSLTPEHYVDDETGELAHLGMGVMKRVAGFADPDKTLANVARSQHESYIRNFREFEDALIASRDDTSLIDAAKKDAPEQARIAKEVAERQRSRYGLQQTAVEARETERASKRGEALNLAGGVNNARLAQRDANRKLLGDLINIGQGVNRSSLSQLGTAAANASSREEAFAQAKAQHKAQNVQMGASLAQTAILLAMFL